MGKMCVNSIFLAFLWIFGSYRGQNYVPNMIIIVTCQHWTLVVLLSRNVIFFWLAVCLSVVITGLVDSSYLVTCLEMLLSSTVKHRTMLPGWPLWKVELWWLLVLHLTLRQAFLSYSFCLFSP